MANPSAQPPWVGTAPAAGCSCLIYVPRNSWGEVPLALSCVFRDEKRRLGRSEQLARVAKPWRDRRFLNPRNRSQPGPRTCQLSDCQRAPQPLGLRH